MPIFLDKAKSTANAIVEKLKPYCSRIEVVGSIRRRVPQVNDIDIVLIPRDYWNLYNEILSLCAPFNPKASGKKIMRITVLGTQVDLYFATPETWATLLLIRTGSTQNNIRLCTLAKKKGWHLSASGDGLFDENGHKIAGDTEESIYNSLGIPYQNPRERN